MTTFQGWNKIATHSDYLGLAPDRRKLIRDQWFKENVESTPEFQGRPEETRRAMLQVFNEDSLALEDKTLEAGAERTVVGSITDTGVSLAKGVVGVGEALVGLADIPTFGYTGKTLETLGYDPASAKATLDDLYTPAQKLANDRVDQADGFIDTAKAAIQNPSVIMHAGIESAPSMIGGAGAARTVIAKGLTKSPMIAAAVGEGLVGGGMAAEQTRQGNAEGLLSPKQVGTSVAAGIGTSIFGLAGGRLAKKFGFADVDTLLAGSGIRKKSGDVVKRIIGGGISEGVFEELPQSVQEQIWQNAALDTPLLEGVGKSAAMGTLVGASMGSTANLAARSVPPGELPDEDSNAKAGTGGKVPILSNKKKNLLEKKPSDTVDPASLIMEDLGSDKDPITLDVPPFDSRTQDPAESTTTEKAPITLEVPPFEFPKHDPAEHAAMEQDIMRQRSEETTPAGQPMDLAAKVRADNQLIMDEGDSIPPVPVQQEDDYMANRGIYGDLDERMATPNAEAYSPEVATQHAALRQQPALPPGQGFEMVDPEPITPPAVPTPAAAPPEEGGLVPEPINQQSNKESEIDQEVDFDGAEIVSEESNKPVTANEIDTAAQKAATSPQNDLPEPTEKQTKAGNYKKGHIKVQGLDISIENPEGSTRSGTSQDGKKWETKMHGHYGYFKRTEGRDGDQVDVFVSSDPKEDSDVYIIDQVNPETGKFDEHKVVMGTDSEDTARELYLSNYEDGWQGLGAITEVEVPDLKVWLKDGKKTKPFAPKLPEPQTEGPDAPNVGDEGGLNNDIHVKKDGTPFTEKGAKMAAQKRPDAVAVEYSPGKWGLQETPPIAVDSPLPKASWRFIKSDDGAIDMGKIDASISKKIRRQAGPIRLQAGDENYGNYHIEKRHGDEIRQAGYQDIKSFVAKIAKGYDEIWSGDKGDLLLAKQNGGTKIAFVRLKPSRKGDFYTVQTAFLTNRSNYSGKRNRMRLWKRSAPASPASGQPTSFVDSAESNTGPAAPNALSRKAESVSVKEPLLHVARAVDSGQPTPFPTVDTNGRANDSRRSGQSSITENIEQQGERGNKKMPQEGEGPLNGEPRNESSALTNKDAGGYAEPKIKLSIKSTSKEPPHAQGTVTEDTKTLQKALEQHLRRPLPRNMFTETAPMPDAVDEAVGARAVARAFKKRVVFFHNNNPKAYDLDGAYVPSNKDVVYLNAIKEKPHMYVTGHELTHALSKEAPDLYKELRVVALGEMQNFSRSKEALDRTYEAVGHKERSGFNEAAEELIGDFVGEQMTDKAFWMKIAGQKPSIFTKLASKVRQFINRLLLKLGKSGKAQQYFKDIRKVRDAVEHALEEYAKRTKNGELPPGKKATESVFTKTKSKNGKRGKKNTGPFSEENRRIRENDKTLWKKAGKIIRRQLFPGGLLPKGVHDDKTARDNQFNTIEFYTRHTVGFFEKSVKRDYGKPYHKLPEATQLKLSKALDGKVPDDIPSSTKTAIVAMRRYIDALSNEYAGILFDQIKAITEEHGDTAEAAAKIDLLNTITGNMGKYVHRSYRAFDDANWHKRVPDDVLNNAREYLRERHVSKGSTADEANRLAEVAINEILKNGTAYDSMESFIKESKLGAKDLSTLKRRKDIAPEIRALLGEYTDPRLNFAKTATKMGRLIWNQRFLDKVRESGMGVFLFEGKNRPPEATKQIAADGSETYSPLNGLWTFPEVEQAFKDALGKEQMNKWWRHWVQVNGAVKFGKTVLSPTTAARNWQSAMFFALANGHFNLTHMGKSLSGLREYFTHQGKGKKLKYLRKLQQLGVVYDTPYAGEMMRLLEDSRLEDALLSGKGRLTLKKALEYTQKFYQYGDDFWKIIGFENEKSMLIKSGMEEAAAEKEAAERIRNTYPTYSMVGKFVQSLRRFPLVGTFVSFPAEIIRTSANIVRYIAKDMKTPGRRAMALRRAAGLAITSGMFYGMQSISRMLLDVDDEEDEATRRLAAPWQRNSNLLYTNRDENGALQYIDLSFLDPYNYWKRPITAVLRDQPWEQTLSDVMVETLEPFLGTDITAGVLFEIVSNKRRDTGTPIYKEHDLPQNQLKAISKHLLKLMPGLYSNVARTWKAIDGQVSPSGKKYNLNDELAAWVGWRVTTIDPKIALYYRTFEFSDAKRDATSGLYRTLRDRNKVDDKDLKKAYLTTKRLREKAYRELYLIVNAAKKSGMTNPEIARVLKTSNVSNRDIFALLSGKTPAWTPTIQQIKKDAKKAGTLFGNSKEITRRYFKLMEIIRENK